MSDDAAAAGAGSAGGSCGRARGRAEGMLVRAVTTEARHSGQTQCTSFSHLSTHAAWNSWPHGRTRSVSPTCARVVVSVSFPKCPSSFSVLVFFGSLSVAPSSLGGDGRHSAGARSDAKYGAAAQGECAPHTPPSTRSTPPCPLPPYDAVCTVTTLPPPCACRCRWRWRWPPPPPPWSPWSRSKHATRCDPPPTRARAAVPWPRALAPGGPPALPHPCVSLPAARLWATSTSALHTSNAPDHRAC